MKSGRYYFVTPENKWVGLSRDYTDALRKYAELVTPCQANVATVAGIINKYLADNTELTLKTRTEYERYSPLLQAAFDGFAAAEVEPHHVWQYLQSRKQQGAPVSGNREKALLSAAFSHAMRHGIVKSNPCRGIGRNKERPRDRLVSDDELDRFLKFARALKIGDLAVHKDPSRARKRVAEEPLYSAQLVAAVVEIGYLTSQRRQSLLAVTLADISESGILFRQQKTGVQVEVQWTPRLRAAVSAAKALPRPVRSLALFARHDGQPYAVEGFKTLIQRVMAAWVAAGNIRFTLHDMRAKAITAKLDRGEDPKNISGHRSDHAINSTYDRRRVRRGTANE
ncbi:tyrosine-type recombinase/integrase [Silvimonas sp. JCM 19000]